MKNKPMDLYECERHHSNTEDSEREKKNEVESNFWSYDIYCFVRIYQK